MLKRLRSLPNSVTPAPTETAPAPPPRTRDARAPRPSQRVPRPAVRHATLSDVDDFAPEFQDDEPPTSGPGHGARSWSDRQTAAEAAWRSKCHAMKEEYIESAELRDRQQAELRAVVLQQVQQRVDAAFDTWTSEHNCDSQSPGPDVTVARAEVQYIGLVGCGRSSCPAGLV